MNKRAVGTAYEKIACGYLEDQKIEIITVNFRTRFGEIDIIGREKEYLLFIEVKYRSYKNQGGARYAISRSKQNKIASVAKAFLSMSGYPADTFCRFDALLIDGDEIIYIRDAWRMGM